MPSSSSSGSSAPSPTGIHQANELLARACAPLDPWGRAPFAGVLSQGLPGTPLGDLFRLGDQLREYRGDSHIAAWVSAGFDATEIGLLTELYWGMPSRSYVRTRAWTDGDLDAAEARLEARGPDGRPPAHRRGPGASARRSSSSTDAAMVPTLDALGDDLDELAALLTPWDAAVMDAGGSSALAARASPVPEGPNSRSSQKGHGPGMSWGT